MSSYCPTVDTGEETTFEEQVEEAIDFIIEARNNLLNASERFSWLDQFEWASDINKMECGIQMLQKSIEEYFNLDVSNSEEFNMVNSKLVIHGMYTMYELRITILGIKEMSISQERHDLVKMIDDVMNPLDKLIYELEKERNEQKK